MKQDIHPTYYEKAKVKCACGNVIETGATQEEIKTDICSNCHPFYTGKEKMLDVAGRIEKFKARQKKAVPGVKNKATKKSEKKVKEEGEE